MSTAKKTKKAKKAIDHKRIRRWWAESEARATLQLDGLDVYTTGKNEGKTKPARGPSVSRCDRESGNTKLRKTCEIMAKDHGWDAQIASWALPAVSTCPGAKDCLSYCLALQGRYTTQPVADLRFRNRVALQRAEDANGIEGMADLLFDCFKSWIVSLPGVTTHAIMRLHDSGDFFSQSYVDAMTQAIERVHAFIDGHPRLKGMEFRPYGYTKSLNLELDELIKAGVSLVQSHGGRFDKLIDPSLPISQVGTKESKPPSNEWRSGQSDEHMDTLALLGFKRIWLEYHGTYSQPEMLEKRSVQLYNITERQAV